MNTVDLSKFAPQIINAVSVRDFFALNNIQVDRHGFCRCPFHGEKTASLKVYDNGRGWVCYGCKAGGDVINAARRLYDIGFNAAIRRLNDEFSLGLPLAEVLTDKQRFEAETARFKAKKQREAQAKREREEEEAYLELFNQWLDCERRLADMADRVDRAAETPFEMSELILKREKLRIIINSIEERRSEEWVMKHCQQN